jgi:GNAT superfamily N-acetyltransferase
VTERLLLERLGADAWPPLVQVEVDGWRLRASRGVTRRGNSALPLTCGRPLQEVQDFFAQRGLPPAVQVSDPDLDAELAGRGWTLEMPTQVMTGPVPQGLAGDVATTADEDWLRCWWAVDGRGGEAELAVARTCLSRVTAPAGYARVAVCGRTVAVARGVVQEGWLGVFAMAVLPEHRRQGLASRLLGALGTWAGGHGATSAYLQVRRDNDAALRLYARHGMAAAYPYAYRYGPRA